MDDPIMNQRSGYWEPSEDTCDEDTECNIRQDEIEREKNGL